MRLHKLCKGSPTCLVLFFGVEKVKIEQERVSIGTLSTQPGT